jgi:hypothetical protein
MGSLWLLEYRPAVVPAPAGPFRSLELLFQIQSNEAIREIVQEGIRPGFLPKSLSLGHFGITQAKKVG